MDTTHNTLPQDFLEKLPHIVPSEKLQAVQSSFLFPKPSTFRANTLKVSPIDLESKLSEAHIPFEKVQFLEGVYVLKNIPQKELTNTDIYNEGYIYIQSISSMIPPLVLNPQPEDQVLDLTAAPGSKTTQMASLMHNGGKIIANDSSTIRVYKLQANLKIQGVTNTDVLRMDAQKLWKSYPEYFDKTLVDVPCSMEGRFLTSYEKSYKDWSRKKVKIMAQMQKFILRSAVSATKPGGTIVYSTCTLSPEENEEVINWIIEKEKGKLEIETIDLKIPDFTDGLTEWKGKSLNPSLSKTKRILPSALMEGFYVAKLKKTASTIPSQLIA